MDRYREYLQDVEIARSVIEDEFLLPSTSDILYDLYAVPSHNHQAYYAMIFERYENYQMVYARTEIYTCHFPEPIRMYPFSDAVEADKHDDSVGRIIMGITTIGTDLIRTLDDIKSLVVPTQFIQQNLIVIDGVFQAIRIFDHGTISKEVVFRDAISIPLSSENSYIIDNMNELYLTIEDIILG